MKTVYLPQTWTLSGKIGTISAVVPGCVHTDLYRNGLLPDIYWRENARDCQWIEQEDWVYRCTFDADTEETAYLVFEGLDTYCSVYLNGTLLGQTDNMFIAYEFPVTGLLQDKENVLELQFRSPVREVEGLPWRDAAFTYERLYSRRVQCTYGWDWVERFVTCGVWRPVYLRYGADMHADSVYIVTENLDQYSAQLYIEMHFCNYEPGMSVEMCIEAPDGQIAYKTQFYCREETVIRRVDIPQPQLWYPNGYGDHPLYRLRVTVGTNVLTEQFGIRTLKVLQLPDAPGSAYEAIARQAKQSPIGKNSDRNETTCGFQVIVNGTPVLCKGANWVPCEPFPSEEREEKYETLIGMAKKMRLNMLRIWGGGIFEKPCFYNLCDQNGILVTHDFLMACGSYPEKEDSFLEQLHREAVYAAKRLRNHPCLAWWSGDNENAVKGCDRMEDYTGRDAALRGLAPEIYRLDSRRPFLPSSPYGGEPYGSITCGTTHNTNFLDTFWPYFEGASRTDYKAFLEQFYARFIAEEPTFGLAGLPTLRRFMTEEDLLDEDESVIRYHTKTNPFFKREYFAYVKDFTRKVLGDLSDDMDRLFKYKYIQYEWVRVVFENMRRRIGYCNGLIFWMFEDCWPAAMGWSLIDYYTFPKAAYYSFARCAKAVASSIVCKDETYEVILSNEGTQACAVEGCAYCLDMEHGMVVTNKHHFAVTAGAYATAAVTLPWKPQSENLIVCDCTADGCADRSFYKDGDLALHRVEHGLCVVQQSDRCITLRAEQYIHAVELEGEYLFSDNYFSLLPNEEKTVQMQPHGSESNDELTVSGYTL